MEIHSVNTNLYITHIVNLITLSVKIARTGFASVLSTSEIPINSPSALHKYTGLLDTDQI